MVVPFGRIAASVPRILGFGKCSTPGHCQGMRSLGRSVVGTHLQRPADVFGSWGGGPECARHPPFVRRRAPRLQLDPRGAWPWIDARPIPHRRELRLFQGNLCRTVPQTVPMRQCRIAPILCAVFGWFAPHGPIARGGTLASQPSPPPIVVAESSLGGATGVGRHSGESGPSQHHTRDIPRT